ncbi:hypothetical protein [Shewanella inventionis]|uniref:hypothetical protein n=1 Tax=Shewanella inventionis TaxID=1738770 RepID=UPI001CC1A1DA|nr:hypothetical protein [Shewanella inventionis]MCL1156539.1 hypothetical protein [Shewanella inventionis]
MNQIVQSNMPLRVKILVGLYAILTLVAFWRMTTFYAFDLLTLGVLPLLFGILTRAKWTKVVLFCYAAIQTLGLAAMTTTAIIAYQITPNDVNLAFQGYNVPLIPLWVLLASLIGFQWWVGLSKTTHVYLASKPS